MQAEADQQLDSAFQEFKLGKFKETPQNWLLNSWQGDALQVTAGDSHSLTMLWLHVTCLAAALWPILFPPQGTNFVSVQLSSSSRIQKWLLQAVVGEATNLQEPTGLPVETLQWVGRNICKVPQNFATHKTIDSLLEGRR